MYLNIVTLKTIHCQFVSTGKLMAYGVRKLKPIREQVEKKLPVLDVPMFLFFRGHMEDKEF